MNENLGQEPFETVEDGQWKNVAMKGASATLHMPGSKAYRDPACLQNINPDVFRPSDSYTTIPHVELYNEIEYAINRFLVPAGINVTDRLFVIGTGKNRETGKMAPGAKAFGLMTLSLTDGREDDDRARAVVGWQNALDGSGRALVAAGEGIWACDNLAFNVMGAHRHTKNIVKNMYSAVYDVVSGLPEQFLSSQRLHTMLRQVNIGVNDSLRLIAQMAAEDCFENMKQFKSAMKQLQFPDYAVFANDKSMWRVYNAATWGIKQSTSPLGVISSTSKVNEFFEDRLAEYC